MKKTHRLSVLPPAVIVCHQSQGRIRKSSFIGQHNLQSWKNQITFTDILMPSTLWAPAQPSIRKEKKLDYLCHMSPFHWPFRCKSCGQRSFSYQAPVIWNQLPVSVRHSTSVSSFKSSLKTFLFLKTFSPVSLPWNATGVCVCVCACVRARVCVCESVWAYVCVCVHVVYVEFWQYVFVKNV